MRPLPQPMRLPRHRKNLTMADNENSSGVQEKSIGKQIVLPWSKAVEISLKSMKTRFWRSLITMSSIVLAIAFLMSIWTSSAVVNSLRTVPEAEAVAARAQLRRIQQLTDALEGGDIGAKEGILAEIPSLQAVLEVAVASAQDELVRVKEEQKDLSESEMRIAVANAEKALANAEEHLSVLQSASTSWNSQRVTSVMLQAADSHVRELRRRSEAIRQILVSQNVEVSDADKESSGGVKQGPLSFISQMSPKDRWLVMLALMVCFVGIVNAMLMSVSERFREIGTMKCLGALDSFVVRLFLLESSFMGLVGTVLGVISGFLLSLFRCSISYGKFTYMYFPGKDILISLLLSVLAGVVLSVLAAVYPARTAARMEPVEAMRVDQ